MKKDKLEEYIKEVKMDKDVKVNSSNVARIAHNQEYAVLEIEFWGRGNKPGTTYRYFPVPYQQFSDMQKAESVGTYFFNNIRNAKGITTVKIEKK